MKHHLEWKDSTLDIRCWGCSEILISISTDGSSIKFDSFADSFEIECENCNSSCEYSLYETDSGDIFQSHDWDSDVDIRDFTGKTGETNRSLWRQYKSLLLDDEPTVKFFEKEFDIVGDYLEALSGPEIDCSTKNDEIIDQYINEHKKINRISKNREQLFRRAINRFYRILKESETISSQD